MKTVTSAGNMHPTERKRLVTKTGKDKAGYNMKLVVSAGKHETDAKRGET